MIKSNKIEKDIPFIFGDFTIENFFQLKKAITKSNFNFNKIKNFFFFKSGRWDIEILSETLIKLPNKEIKESLDLSLVLLNDEKFSNIKLIDVRQKNQVIVDE